MASNASPKSIRHLMAYRLLVEELNEDGQEIVASATAYAMGKPISKSAQEQVEPAADDKESENSL